MFAQKLSEEKSVQSNFRNKPPQKNENFRHRYLKKHLYKKNEGNILPKYIWRKIIHRTICEGKLSTKQALHKSIFQTNSKRNLYQRIFEETCLPNIAWNESLPTKYLKRNLSPEYFSNNFSTKICFKKWYRGSSEETFRKQKQCISTKKSL